MTPTLAALDPATTALLVMDVQPAVLGNLEDAEGVLVSVEHAVASARRHRAHVGYVRVGFEEAEIDAVPEHGAMASARPMMRDRLSAASPHTQVHDRVAPRDGDVVVRKTRIGAFSTTDLDDQLREAGVDTLVLAGVSTSGVVLSTVRDAHDRDYRVLVLVDATADPDPRVHAFLTERIFPGQAEVITTAELDERLGHGER